MLLVLAQFEGRGSSFTIALHCIELTQVEIQSLCPCHVMFLGHTQQKHIQEMRTQCRKQEKHTNVVMLPPKLLWSCIHSFCGLVLMDKGLRGEFRGRDRCKQRSRGQTLAKTQRCRKLTTCGHSSFGGQSDQLLVKDALSTSHCHCYKFIQRTPNRTENETKQTFAFQEIETLEAQSTDPKLPIQSNTSKSCAYQSAKCF